MATNSTYYLNAANLTTATTVYLDAFLTSIAPDGFYGNGTITREQVSGVLLDPVFCTGCDECTCYELSSIPSEIGIDNTEFDYIDCFTDEAASIIVFVDNAVNICAKTGSVTAGAGNPGTIGPSVEDCCTGTGLYFGQRSSGFNEGEGDCFTVPFMNIYISGLPCDISNGDIACNTNNILDTFDGLNEYYAIYKSICPTETYTYIVQINNFGVISVIENCIPPPEN